MRAKQAWEVTLTFIEDEGDIAAHPWYSSKDVEMLIRTTLAQGQESSLRDLRLQAIVAHPEGAIYYDGTK